MASCWTRSKARTSTICITAGTVHSHSRTHKTPALTDACERARTNARANRVPYTPARLISWCRWQFKLDIATFNGDEEILILLDFANQFEMHAEAMGTCECE